VPGAALDQELAEAAVCNPTARVAPLSIQQLAAAAAAAACDQQFAAPPLATNI
jgi:hypothetical protein